MAVKERARPDVRTPTSPRPGARAVAEEEQVVPMPLDVVRRLILDVPAWPVWDPSVVASRHLAGESGVEGMVNEVSVGVPALSRAFIQMLIAAAPKVTVFAGGRGRHLRFIDKIELTDGGETTLVSRRLEIHLGRRLAALRRPVRVVARAYLRRSLGALT